MATNKLMSKYLPQILFFLVEAVDKSGFFLRLCQIDSCLYSNIVIWNHWLRTNSDGKKDPKKKKKGNSSFAYSTGQGIIVVFQHRVEFNFCECMCWT